MTDVVNLTHLKNNCIGATFLFVVAAISLAFSQLVRFLIADRGAVPGGGVPRQNASLS
jgi:hypothetical protein